MFLDLFKSLLFSFSVLISIGASATEGMWIPSLLQSLNEDDMVTMGLEIPVEAIYSINQGSLKDAIVHFGGGCTAEMISSEGLLLTNHHCGFSQIQSHSSVENDYLKEGFWAMSRAEELPNAGLTATFVVRMEDVSERVLKAFNEAANDEKQNRLAAEIELIKKEWNEKTGLDAEIKPFNFGNSYFLILTKTYLDVRLVGAPPSAIGKFGGDTDNWVWPRHTGDFSIFRIYAGQDNEPAPYAEDNQAFKPKKHLPVSLNGVQEGDFCMVFGFPGVTEQYLVADAVDHVINHLNPDRIAMRDAALSVMNASMKSSDELRIKYAAKQSSIANAWKKWIGQNQGLIEVGALNIKEEFESEFIKRAAKKNLPQYTDALNALNAIQKEYEPYLMARAYYIEYLYYGHELLSFTGAFKKLVENYSELESQDQFDEEIEGLKSYVRAFYKDFDLDTDKQLFERHTPLFLNGIADGVDALTFRQLTQKSKGSIQAFSSEMYANSVFADSTKLIAQLDKMSPKVIKKWKKDLAFQAMNASYNWYFTDIRSEYGRLKSSMDSGMKLYIEGIAELFPEKTMWFDANSTLRLTYGKVEGSSPWDGMEYKYYSTGSGILQKHKTNNPDFELPQRMVNLLEKKNFGIYGDENDELRICFTGSNHTTGGNSGSPAINGKGELIGLNFDRSWESTMSDIMFDASRCRNIMVDVRYILWVIDKYAGATHLVDEMTVVKGEKENPEKN